METSSSLVLSQGEGLSCAVPALRHCEGFALERAPQRADDNTVAPSMTQLKSLNRLKTYDQKGLFEGLRTSFTGQHA
jgi:hypothetical protein